MTLPELREQKGRLAAEADAILQAARKENRADLRKDEIEKFDAIHVDIEKLTATISRTEKQDAVMADLAEPQERKAAPNAVSTRTTMTGRPNDFERGEAMRSWLLAGTHGYQPSNEAMSLAARCGVNLHSNTMTLRFAPTPLKATQPSEFGLRASAEDVRVWKQANEEQRAALTGLQSSTTTGGNTVADEMMRSLEVALLAYGGMRSVATVIRTSTGGPLPIPTTNDTTAKGEIIGENSLINELEMTFGQVVLGAWKYSSKYIKASMEFMQDSSINVSAFLGEALGTRIARITNDHFTTGSGSAPNGVVTAATSSSITTDADDYVDYDDFVDLLHSVDPSYRTNARWMFSDAGLKLAKKIKTYLYSGDVVGTPLWVPGLANGQADTILGYPYTINQSVATPAAGSLSFLFGDFSKYIIRDVMDVELRRLDERFAEYGQVAFLAFSRHDGDLLDAGTNPIKYMTQGS